MNFLLQLSNKVKDFLFYPLNIKYMPFKFPLSSLFTSVNTFTSGSSSCKGNQEISNNTTEPNLYEISQLPSPNGTLLDCKQRKLSESTLDTSTCTISRNDSSVSAEDKGEVETKQSSEEKMLELNNGLFTLKLKFKNRLCILKFINVILKTDFS